MLLRGGYTCTLGGPQKVRYLHFLCKESFGELPDDDASGGADVERVLGAKLRNLDATIGGIDHFLVNSLDFIAKDNSVFGVEPPPTPLFRGEKLRIE